MHKIGAYTVGVWFFLSFAMAQAAALNCETHRCMAVVDAGSTKSFLHVYEYELSAVGDPIHIHERLSKKIMPGLASLSVAVIPSYLQALFSELPAQVIPVYFYGTAGMRLLPKSRQQVLYQAIRTWFATEAPAVWQLKAAKTITGQQEGIWGWVAVNEHLGMKAPYVGVMDMGGASVQITYPLTQTGAVNPNDKVTLSVRGQTVHLFVHSFLGLGQTEVMHQLLDEPACYAPGYEMIDDMHIGKGDWNACESKMRTLMHLHDVASVVVPHLHQATVPSWYTIGGLSFLVNKPMLQSSATQIVIGEWMRQARALFCETEWSELSFMDPSDIYLAHACLSSAYYDVLLTKGYGFGPQQIIQMSQDEAADSWALGVVVMQG